MLVPTSLSAILRAAHQLHRLSTRSDRLSHLLLRVPSGERYSIHHLGESRCRGCWFRNLTWCVDKQSSAYCNCIKVRYRCLGPRCPVGTLARTVSLSMKMLSKAAAMTPSGSPLISAILSMLTSSRIYRAE